MQPRTRDNTNTIETWTTTLASSSRRFVRKRIVQHGEKTEIGVVEAGQQRAQNAH
jgi:hypothetical protein